jgi:ATP-binding cassette subfamily B protein
MMAGVLIAGHNVGVQYILAFTLALAYFQTLFEALDGFLCLRDAAAHVDIVDWLLALPAPAARTDRVPAGHELTLEAVAFAYDRGPVLHDVALRFPERAVTAIVGPSGAGKSALAGVIAGIWEPAAGSVRVGGVDVATLAQTARAHTLAVVFQETQMFEESVARNIAAGRPGATREEILCAARIAGCDDFVLALPEGYDTVVRAGGANFSLGERQRIAIARMLLSDARVVVLDECTASLDAAAERAVHRAIAVLAETKTVVLITHRLGTVRHVPQIVVLAGGTVAETGSHEQLLRNGGEYARLWAAHERARRWKLAG